MLQQIKNFVAKTSPGRWLQDWRWLMDLERYRSRLPRDQARRYQDYFERCRRAAGNSAAAESEFMEVTKSWRNDGYAVVFDESMGEIAKAIDADLMARGACENIWDEVSGYYKGDPFLDFPALGELFRPQAPLARAIRAAFGTEFKIFYGTIYESKWSGDRPSGSELWHADGGPGTCMNLMFAFTPLTAGNGAMELIPWRQSLAIFEGERESLRKTADNATSHRDLLCGYYSARIAASKPQIMQPIGPSGTALLFMNNLIHKGGYPTQPNAHRRVIVLHVYPSDKPAPIDRYLREGLRKKASYPENPDF